MNKENRKAKSKKNLAAGALLLCVLALCGLLVWRQAQQPAVIAQSEVVSSSASETPASSACSENGIASGSENAESAVSTATTDAPTTERSENAGPKQYDPDGDGNYDVPCDDGSIMHFTNGEYTSLTEMASDGTMLEVPAGKVWDALSEEEKVEWRKKLVGDAYGGKVSTNVGGAIQHQLDAGTVLQL